MRIAQVLSTLHAVVPGSAAIGRDTGPANRNLSRASETTVAHIAERLKARQVGETCTVEQMLAHLGIEVNSLQKYGQALETINEAQLKDPNRSLSIVSWNKGQNEGEIKTVDVYDSKQSSILLTWNSKNGLEIPEAATEDINASYLINQPVTTPWSEEKAGYLTTDLNRRAAQWHDSRIAAWNKAFADDGWELERPSLPAMEEIGRSHGTFTIRIPKQYVPDGTWGMVIVFGQSYGQYLPLRLREACDRHKCLFADLSPEWKGPGRIWRNLSQIMDGVATLRKSYRFAPERTMLLDQIGDGQAVGFAGALFPDVFRFVGLPDYHPLIPREVEPAEGVRYIRGTWGSKGTFLPFPLGWMTPADWQRNSEAGQRWLWRDGNGISKEVFENVLQPAWSAVNIEITFLQGLGENETPSVPMRCLEAE
jgi:hypothetical protein